MLRMRSKRIVVQLQNMKKVSTHPQKFKKIKKSVTLLSTPGKYTAAGAAAAYLPYNRD